MSTAASHRVIQKPDIDPAGAPSGFANFLLGSGGVALSFFWGLAEATLFFIVPDALLSLASIFSFRRVWRHIVAAIAGAVAGGALMFFWAQTNPDSARAAVKKVPFVTEAMFALVDAGFRKSGMLAVCWTDDRDPVQDLCAGGAEVRLVYVFCARHRSGARMAVYSGQFVFGRMRRSTSHALEQEFRAAGALARAGVDRLLRFLLDANRDELSGSGVRRESACPASTG
jgi:hypothetical protein